MSLETGCRLHRATATVLPVPADVLTWVQALSCRAPTEPFDLEFLDRNGVPIPEVPADDSDDNASVVPHSPLPGKQEALLLTTMDKETSLIKLHQCK